MQYMVQITLSCIIKSQIHNNTMQSKRNNTRLKNIKNVKSVGLAKKSRNKIYFHTHNNRSNNFQIHQIDAMTSMLFKILHSNTTQQKQLSHIHCDSTCTCTHTHTHLNTKGRYITPGLDCTLCVFITNSEVPEKLDSNTFRFWVCLVCTISYLPINTLLGPWKHLHSQKHASHGMNFKVV